MSPTIAKIAQLYRHEKGGVYFVSGIATHSEAGEELVIYRCWDPGSSNRLWARPREMFEDGRFVRLSDATPTPAEQIDGTE